MIVYVKHGADDPIRCSSSEAALLSQDTVVEIGATYCDEACAAGVANTLFAGDPDSLEQLHARRSRRSSR